MKDSLAKRIKTLETSPTMALDTKAKKLKSQGLSIINLTAGEPDFDTPDNIKKAAIKAIEKGFTKYTEAKGTLELRTAIAKKFEKDNKIIYDPSQIIVANGAKQILFSIFQVLCNEKDEVIIPIPAWNTFVEQVKLTGAKPVLVKLKEPYKLTNIDIAKAITPKTKIILINSPANPTGAMIDREELEKIGQLAVKHNLWIVADEIYEKLAYTGTHISIASLNDQIKERTITVNGVSKAYAMTGWRLGFAGGPQKIIDAMTKLQVHLASNASSISQKASLEALTGNQKSIKIMHDEFAKRRKYIIKEFSQIEKLSFVEPEGAFYFFVSITKLLNKQYPTSAIWCETLLEKEKVAVVPGEAFFYPNHFRMSFAASMIDLKTAIDKIKNFISTYET